MRPETKAPVRATPTFIERARRSQIAAAAIETLAELGYQRSSLAEIAKRAGIGKSVISYHFSGKHELIAHVVDDVYATARAVMLPRLEACATARSMLREYVAGNVAFMKQHPNHVRAIVEIIFNMRPGDDDASALHARSRASLSDLEAILRRGQDTGEFRAFDVTVLAVAIRAAIDALPPRMAYSRDLDLDQYAEELVTLFDLATRKNDRTTKVVGTGKDVKTARNGKSPKGART